MTDYEKYKLTFSEAEKEVTEYDNMTDTDFNGRLRQWAQFEVQEQEPPYREIREAVVKEFQNSLNASGKIGYTLDLTVGIKLYELLNPENGFDIITANDNDVWRYISLRVIPDLTFIRYPNHVEDTNVITEVIPNISYTRIETEKGSIRLKKKRFYSHPRRIWAKTLWWYVYLGWQGDSDKTYDVLKNNGTNIISHFIERPGRGYRETLFRSMLYAYSLLPEQKDSIFRAAAKLNLAKCVSLEPALTEDGELGYSVRLFDEVCKKEADKKNAEGDDFE